MEHKINHSCFLRLLRESTELNNIKTQSRLYFAFYPFFLFFFLVGFDFESPTQNEVEFNCKLLNAKFAERDLITRNCYYSIHTASKSEMTSFRNRRHSRPWLFTVSSE